MRLRFTKPPNLMLTKCHERDDIKETVGLTVKEARRSALMASIGLATIAASFLYAPWSQTGPVLCPFRLLTGLPCPGCGLTRSFCAIAQGRWGDAFADHLFGPALMAALVVGIPLLYAEALTRRANPLLRAILYSKRLGLVAGGALFGYHAIRVIDLGHAGTLWSAIHHAPIISAVQWAWHWVV